MTWERLIYNLNACYEHQHGETTESLGVTMKDGTKVPIIEGGKLVADLDHGHEVVFGAARSASMD